MLWLVCDFWNIRWGWWVCTIDWLFIACRLHFVICVFVSFGLIIGTAQFLLVGFVLMLICCLEYWGCTYMSNLDCGFYYDCLLVFGCFDWVWFSICCNSYYRLNVFRFVFVWCFLLDRWGNFGIDCVCFFVWVCWWCFVCCGFDSYCDLVCTLCLWFVL